MLGIALAVGDVTAHVVPTLVSLAPDGIATGQLMQDSIDKTLGVGSF